MLVVLQLTVIHQAVAEEQVPLVMVVGQVELVALVQQVPY